MTPTRGQDDQEEAFQGRNRSSLAQAKEMAAQGKTQIEIADALGVSVMTLHRWRNGTARAPSLSDAHAPMRQFDESADRNEQISELRLENSRLRRLVTDCCSSG